VLLPAGSKMHVKSHLNAGNGLLMITLLMIRTDNCIINLNEHLPLADQTQTSTACAIDGLDEVLAAAKIDEELSARIKAWCKEQRAAELQELQELFDDPATDCSLPALPKKRLQKALNEKLG